MRRLLCVLLLAILLCGQALAVDLSLPDELKKTAPEAAKLFGTDPADGFGLVDGAAEILRRELKDEGQRYLRDSAPLRGSYWV